MKRLIFVLLLVGASVSAREVLDFDSNWKFALGDHPAAAKVAFADVKTGRNGMHDDVPAETITIESAEVLAE